MKTLCLWFLCLLVLVCAGVRADRRKETLPGHVAAKDILFIDFPRESIVYDAERALGFSEEDNKALHIVCQATHPRHAKENAISDLHLKCFSTFETHGLAVEVDSAQCAMDSSDSEFIEITTPIRDGSCTLTPRFVPLPSDYQTELDLFKNGQVWFCKTSNCSDVDITFYDIVRHVMLERMEKIDAGTVCGTQICSLNQHSMISFYKNLFLLLWNK